MSDADLRIDPLTGAYVVVTPWRQQRPNRPDGLCPFCPGGLEAPEPYDVRHFPNRWPALPDGCHEVILHSPDHTASFPDLGEEQAARVVELWSARTAALGSRDDVKYVFVFENRGRMIGATIDHPHSQIMAFTMIPPVVAAELSAGKCDLCQGRRRRSGGDPPVRLASGGAVGALVAVRDAALPPQPRSRSARGRPRVADRAGRGAGGGAHPDGTAAGAGYALHALDPPAADGRERLARRTPPPASDAGPEGSWRSPPPRRRGIRGRRFFDPVDPRQAAAQLRQ